MKVGSFAGGTITLDKKLADGSSITITKDDLGIETALDDGHKFTVNEIGRASCRERVCLYV